MARRKFSVLIVLLFLLVCASAVKAEILYVDKFDDIYDSMDIWNSLEGHDESGKLVWDSAAVVWHWVSFDTFEDVAVRVVFEMDVTGVPEDAYNRIAIGWFGEPPDYPGRVGMSQFLTFDPKFNEIHILVSEAQTTAIDSNGEECVCSYEFSDVAKFDATVCIQGGDMYTVRVSDWNDNVIAEWQYKGGPDNPTSGTISLFAYDLRNKTTFHGVVLGETMDDVLNYDMGQ